MVKIRTSVFSTRLYHFAFKKIYRRTSVLACMQNLRVRHRENFYKVMGKISCTFYLQVLGFKGALSFSVRY